MRQNIVTHIGTVTEVSGRPVRASFEPREACGDCQAKTLCESGRGRLITVEAEVAEGLDFQKGQRVNVCLDTRTASLSVMLAYVYPLLLLFAVMFGVMALTGSTDAGCLSALASVPVYYIILYMCRLKIKKKIKFAITEI